MSVLVVEELGSLNNSVEQEGKKHWTGTIRLFIFNSV